jgi:hypothetical protein
MGRLVLIDFDDNAMAERFLAEHENMKLVMNKDELPYNIVGIFIKPGMLCECQSKTDKSFRGAKFGLWACKVCRKVKPYSGQYLSDLRKRDVRTKDRYLWISVRFKMQDGKVVVVTDG